MAAPEGYNALGKIGVSYKGEYASNTAYERLDAVYHNGSTYLALKDAPAGAPNDDGVNWTFLAKGFPSDIGESEIAFEQAADRTNIATGESIKTVFGRIKKWFADMTAAAFAQVITSNTDLMATTVAGYLPDALAVKQQFDDVNSKLQIPVFLSETSGTGQNVNIDSAQYRYLLINVIDGAYATHTILSPNVISSLAVLGIQSQIGLQTANGYAYLNFTLSNGVFTWSSDSSKTVDIYGIK